MTYKTGIEIECKLATGVTLDDVLTAVARAGITCNDQRHTHTGRLNGCEWKLVRDGTPSDDGAQVWEFVTEPIVSMKKIERRVIAMTTVLQQYCRVDRNCGLHIHFDILGKYHFKRRVDTSTYDGKFRAMQNKPARLFLAEVTRNMRYFQPIFDAFVSPSRRGNSFCRAVPNRADLDSKHDCVLFAENRGGYYSNNPLYALGESKYQTLNISTIETYGTIEYRQHQGTLNPTKILNWIKLMERFTTRAWDRRYKTLNCEDFLLDVDGLFDFLGFGYDSRNIREYYRRRALNFGYPAIANR